MLVEMATPAMAAPAGKAGVSLRVILSASRGRNRTTTTAIPTPMTPATKVATTDSMKTAKKTRVTEAPTARRMPISRTR